MTDHALGMASDFYRLRMFTLDEGGAPDLEWRDDILYRDPPGQRPEEHQEWVVQAVELSDDDKATEIGRFGEADEARALLDEADEDLVQMTRTEFEARYFPILP